MLVPYTHVVLLIPDSESVAVNGIVMLVVVVVVVPSVNAGTDGSSLLTLCVCDVK